MDCGNISLRCGDTTVDLYKKQIKATVIKSGNSSRIYLSTSDNICYQELSTEEGGCIHDDNI